MASREDQLSLHLNDQFLRRKLLTEDHNTRTNVDRNSSSLGLFSRTNQGSMLVVYQLLLPVLEVLDLIKGVGHVGNHTTSVIS